MRTLVLFLFLMATAWSQDVTALIAEGDALDRQWKTQEALAIYLKADEASPGNAEILHRVAKQYGLSMNDVSAKSEKIAFGQKALDAAQRAVKADPQNADAQLALAICYGRLALLTDSRTKIEYARLIKQHAQRSTELNPKNDLAWHVLGAWSSGMANLNPILRAIAQTVYGQLPRATNEEAVAYFQKAIALNPQRVGNYVELGLTYQLMGNRSAAREALEKGISLPKREKDDAESQRRAREALKKL